MLCLNSKNLRLDACDLDGQGAHQTRQPARQQGVPRQFFRKMEAWSHHPTVVWLQTHQLKGTWEACKHMPTRGEREVCVAIGRERMSPYKKN